MILRNFAERLNQFARRSLGSTKPPTVQVTHTKGSVEDVKFSAYDRNGNPYITRTQCTIYFLQRTFFIAVFFAGLSGGTLVLSQILRGEPAYAIEKSISPVIQLWVVAFPVILFCGMAHGQSMWRATYREHPFKRTIPSWILAVLAILLQVFLIFAIYPPMGEAALFSQQCMALGSVVLHELLACRNIVFDWHLQGRLPPDGTSRFQISVRTALIMSLSFGIWMVLLFWAFD